MRLINTPEALQTYINEKIRSKLDPVASQADFRIDIALKRYIINESAEWDQLVREVAESNFNSENEAENDNGVRLRLDKLAEKIVTEVKSDKKLSSDRSATQRLINDYFLPNLLDAHNNTTTEIARINDRLNDQENPELLQYKLALTSNAEYLDSLAALPFALEKMLAAIKENLGHNYTPRKNAQVLASLLDTVQKSQEGGSWTARALLEAVKLASKLTMPDLPADAFTLDTIQELLPYVNNVIDKGRALQNQLNVIFPKSDVEKTAARKALFESMGIEFNSLGTICQRTLLKPAEDALQAAGSFWSALGTVYTEDGIDYLRTLSTLDQLGDLLHGMPQELVPTSLKQFSDCYQSAKERVGQAAGYVSTGAGYVTAGVGYVASGLSSIGTMAYNYTPESLKNAAGAAADTAADIVARTALSVGPTFNTIASAVEYITPTTAVSRLIPSTAVGRLIPFLNKQTLINLKDRAVNTIDWFVPNSVKERMRPKTPESLFWKSIKPEGALDPKVAEAYLTFLELASVSESPAMEEDFFHAQMSKNGIFEANYSDYTALKQRLSSETMTMSLNQLQASLEGEDDPERRFDGMLYMVHRLRNLEKSAGQTEAVAPILTELRDALHHESHNDSILAFQRVHVRPTLEKAMLICEQKQFGPLLEKALDLDAENTGLRQIYSRLKANQTLSSIDLQSLEQFSQSSDIKFTIPQVVKDVTVELISELPTEELTKALTPNEELRAIMQTSLDNTLAPISRHIGQGLQKQLDACQRLKALCPNEPLKTSCESKIAYLEKLIQCNTRLLIDIEQGGVLAEQLRKLTSGDAIADALKMSADAKTMAKQLISGAWDVVLPKGAMTDASMSEKLLAYALSNNQYFQGIVEAKKHFDVTLKSTPPPPELMLALGNPLNNPVKAEGLVQKGVEVLVGIGRDYLAKPMATSFVASTALSFIFPQALVAEIALGILMRDSVQRRLGQVFEPVTDLLAPVTAPVTEFMGKQQQNLIDSVTDYLCPMLNIEVQKVLEQKAFEYASSYPAARSAMPRSGRDSFSGFYLQYRAIQKNNPLLDKEDCIKFLFKSFLEGKEPEKQANIISTFRNEFERLDNVFKLQDATDVELQNTGELERELQFLMENIDFNAPDEIALVTMSIYNRLIMMQFNAAEQIKQSNEGEARKLEQKAISVLESVLQKLENDDANVSPDDFASARTNVRAEALLPATQFVAQVKLEELKTKLLAISELINTNVRDREEQLVSAEPRFGQSVLANEYAKSTKTSLAYKIGSAISRVATPIIVWASVGMAVASQGIVPAVLTALGVATATAGAVGTGGLVVAGAVLLGRVAYTTAKEIRARSNEFKAISESDASPLKKFGLRVLTGLKCLGKGLVRAVMVDTLFGKVRDFFGKGVKPIVDEAQNLRHLARVYPSQEVLITEKESLNELQENLKALKGLVEAQVNDKSEVAKEAGGGYGIIVPGAGQFYNYDDYRKSLKTHADIQVRAGQIETKTTEIQRCFQKTYDLLQRPTNDARWVLGVNQQLDQYKEAFTRLNEVMAQVNLVEKVGKSMRPQMRDYQKAVKQAEQHLHIATNAAVSLQGQESALLDELKAKTGHDMQEVANDIQGRIVVISNAANQVEQYANHAIAIVNKTGGEVGRFTKMTDGPATTAKGEAQSALAQAETLKAYVNQLSLKVANEIAAKTVLGAQVEDNTIRPTPEHPQEQERISPDSGIGEENTGSEESEASSDGQRERVVSPESSVDAVENPTPSLSETDEEETFYEFENTEEEIFYEIENDTVESSSKSSPENAVHGARYFKDEYLHMKETSSKTSSDSDGKKEEEAPMPPCFKDEFLHIKEKPTKTSSDGDGENEEETPTPHS